MSKVIRIVFFTCPSLPIRETSIKTNPGEYEIDYVAISRQSMTDLMNDKVKWAYK